MEVKQSLTAFGETHFCPPIAAQGSAAREIAEAFAPVPTANKTANDAKLPLNFTIVEV